MSGKAVDKENAAMAREADSPTGAIPKSPRRGPYTPPRILSAEPLEIAAAVCYPPTALFGKNKTAFTCATLGS